MQINSARKSIRESIREISKCYATLCLCLMMLLQAGCATGQTKTIAIGMAGGAVTGALVGHQFVHHGQQKQFETQNTIITSILFALITGGILAWHYEGLAQQSVEISGQYARFRLCDPDELNPDLARKLGVVSEENALHIKPEQIGKYAISLDDNTKWAVPTFRKRFLPPERAESQVISNRYIWEILRPGSFVTRTQDPDFFFEEEKKK
jgi:hypothetical protein